MQVVGMGVAWRGGDIVRFPGGGHKVNKQSFFMKQMHSWKHSEQILLSIGAALMEAFRTDLG